MLLTAALDVACLPAALRLFLAVRTGDKMELSGNETCRTYKESNQPANSWPAHQAGVIIGPGRAGASSGDHVSGSHCGVNSTACHCCRLSRPGPGDVLLSVLQRSSLICSVGFLLRTLTLDFQCSISAWVTMAPGC